MTSLCVYHVGQVFQ